MSDRIASLAACGIASRSFATLPRVVLCASFLHALHKMPLLVEHPSLPLRFPPCCSERRVGLRLEILPARVTSCSDAVGHSSALQPFVKCGARCAADSHRALA